MTTEIPVCVRLARERLSMFVNDDVPINARDLRDMLSAVVVEYEALHSQITWQPIETAPKDGTHVILFSLAWGRVTTGLWNFNAIPPRWKTLTGWSIEPTHWQPMPDPPVVGSHGNQSLSGASGSAQSAALKDSSSSPPTAATGGEVTDEQRQAVQELYDAMTLHQAAMTFVSDSESLLSAELEYADRRVMAARSQCRRLGIIRHRDASNIEMTPVRPPFDKQHPPVQQKALPKGSLS